MTLHHPQPPPHHHVPPVDDGVDQVVVEVIKGANTLSVLLPVLSSNNDVPIRTVFHIPVCQILS